MARAASARLATCMLCAQRNKLAAAMIFAVRVDALYGDVVGWVIGYPPSGAGRSRVRLLLFSQLRTDPDFDKALSTQNHQKQQSNVHVILPG